MTSATQKQDLRQAVLAKLKAIPANTRKEYSAQLRKLLSAYLDTDNQLCAALYYPLPHEVDLLPLLPEYPQHIFAFPRCMPGRQLQFHQVKDPATDMQPGAIGIPAPLPQLPIVEPARFDIVIVPGVAFTTGGLRLGYGGGYYDRYLPRCTQAKLLALTYPQQIVDYIPTEAHDLTIPSILTP